MPIEQPVQRAEDNRRQGAAVANRQSTAAYKDYRTQNPAVFVQEAYYGTGGFSGMAKKGFYSYIIPNVSENFYQTRCQMSIYQNHMAKFIDAKWRPVFKHEIKNYVRTESGSVFDEHLYLDFCENVTGSGRDKASFQKSVVKNAFINDVAYVIMDMADGETMPFVYMKRVDELADFRTDAKGALVAAIFDDGVEERAGEKVYKRRYIGIDVFAMLESPDGKEWRVVSEVPNTLGILPVYPFFTEEPENPGDYTPFPSTYSIAAACAYLYDKGSKLDYVIDKQAHSILALQGNIESVPSGVDNALVISESTSTIFPPQYLSPDSAMPGVHLARMEEVLREIYHIMTESGVSVQVSPTTQAESGVAKAYTFNATNTTLKNTVTLLHKFDKWLYETYKVFTGDTSGWASYSEYPTDFTPVSHLGVHEAIQLIEFYGAEGLPKSQVDIHRRLRGLIDPMASSMDDADILGEIEARYTVLD